MGMYIFRLQRYDFFIYIASKIFFLFFFKAVKNSVSLALLTHTSLPSNFPKTTPPDPFFAP